MAGRRVGVVTNGALTYTGSIIQQQTSTTATTRIIRSITGKTRRFTSHTSRPLPIIPTPTLEPTFPGHHIIQVIRMRARRTGNRRIHTANTLYLASRAHPIILVVDRRDRGATRVTEPVKQEVARYARCTVCGVGAAVAYRGASDALFGQGVRVGASWAA